MQDTQAMLLEGTLEDQRDVLADEPQAGACHVARAMLGFSVPFEPPMVWPPERPQERAAGDLPHWLEPNLQHHHQTDGCSFKTQSWNDLLGSNR